MDKAEDGYGQGLWADIRSLIRFRACRKRPTIWSRSPAHDEQIFRAYPVVERFGDAVRAIAHVDDGPWAGQLWITLENDWYGWPDPPQFAFFAMKNGEIWAAMNFGHWPGAWVIADDASVTLTPTS